MRGMDTPFLLRLYLRADGTLLVAKGDQAIEMHLAPAQMVQLGIDLLRVATAQDPEQMPAVLHALETTHVLPSEVPPCPQQH